MDRPAIDSAIDRYLSAAERVGAPEPDGPALERDLEAVRTAVAPLQLSDDVLAMWRRLQSPPAMPYPSWIDARLALDFWRDESLPIFPIAYESHGYLSAGLVGDERERAIWSWAYDAEPARLRFRTLAVAFDAAADALDRRIFQWREEHQYLEVLDHDAWEAIVRIRNEEAAADGAFDPGIDSVDLQSPLSWPESWQRAFGVDVAAAAPRGATTTIRGFLETSSTYATIVGMIVGLEGSAAGSRATVDDGTGRFVVWCPPAADPHFVVRMGNRVEIDLSGPPANLPGLAAAIRAGGFEPGSVDTVASAVRPGRVG